MRSENVILEWKDCRETIARFDNYLLRLRILGFSVYALLFSAIAGAAGIEKATAFLSPEALLFALITLSLYLTAIYILDRYYERMLLVAVLRASLLEALRLEGFRIGLTTEIEFQKERLGERSGARRLSKASHMVNGVYLLVFLTIWAQYYSLSRRAGGGLGYDLVFVALIATVGCVLLLAHRMLREPSHLIASRSQVVSSPVVMSGGEIQRVVKRMAWDICRWLAEENCTTLHVISIVSGGRAFTQDLLSALEQWGEHPELLLHVVSIEATKNNSLRNRCDIMFGRFAPGALEGAAVLIADDLLDSGQTLAKVRHMAVEAGARIVKSAVLIRKYADAEVVPDYIGTDLRLDRFQLREQGIKDYWLFGYGMDLDGQYREIEHIGWVAKKVTRLPSKAHDGRNTWVAGLDRFLMRLEDRLAARLRRLMPGNRPGSRRS